MLSLEEGHPGTLGRGHHWRRGCWWLGPPGEAQTRPARDKNPPSRIGKHRAPAAVRPGGCLEGWVVGSERKAQVPPSTCACWGPSEGPLCSAWGPALRALVS